MSVIDFTYRMTREAQHMIGKFVILVCILSVLSISATAQMVPVLAELEEVSQLPPEVPQRVTALAFDGARLWLAIYLGRGNHVVYDPDTKKWNTAPDEKLKQSIAQVTGQFMSAGGMVFVDNKLWVSSAYGESFGSIELADPAKRVIYKRFHNPSFVGTNSQGYADLTYDGTNIWAVWHLHYYKRDGVNTQVLLKIDKDTGDVLGEFPITARHRADMTHGLAWDGHSLWHAKGNWFTELDRDGKKRNQFKLEKVHRASGLAWDGSSLWIVEFGGKLWRLPFRQ